MRPYFLMIFMFLHSTAFAIVLDCTENSDGTFNCVEIKTEAEKETGKPPQAAATGAAAATAATSTADYRKQAEMLCNYVAPRKRMSGKLAAKERAMEAEKLARKKYQQCLADEAEKLRKVAQ